MMHGSYFLSLTHTHTHTCTYTTHTQTHTQTHAHIHAHTYIHTQQSFTKSLIVHPSSLFLGVKRAQNKVMVKKIQRSYTALTIIACDINGNLLDTDVSVCFRKGVCVMCV